MTRRCLRVSKLSYVEQLPANYFGVFMPAIEVFIAARRSCCTTTSSGEAWRGEAPISPCWQQKVYVRICMSVRLSTCPLRRLMTGLVVEWMLCTAVAMAAALQVWWQGVLWCLAFVCNVSRARLRMPNLSSVAVCMICRRMHPSPFHAHACERLQCAMEAMASKNVCMYVCMSVSLSVCLSVCMYVCMYVCNVM